MNRKEFLQQVTERTGLVALPHHLDRALRRAYVSPRHRRPDGWFRYTARDIEAMSRYMRDRARSATPADATRVERTPKRVGGNRG